MGATYAAIGDLGLLSAEDEAAATPRLSQASALLRARIAGLDDLVAAGTVDAEVLTVVVVDMVQASLRQPGQSVTTGPFTVAYGRDEVGGRLEVLDRHVRMLGLDPALAGARRRRVRQIGIRRGPL